MMKKKEEEVISDDEEVFTITPPQDKRAVADGSMPVRPQPPRQTP
jgi:hypothetical protein